MRRLERGASYVPLIIVLVLLIVAVVWAYIKTDEVDQLKKDLVTAEQTKKDQQEKRVNAYLYLNELGEKLGFPIESPEPPKKIQEFRVDTKKVEDFILEKLGNLREKYVREFPVAIYTFDDNGGVNREGAQEGKVRVGYLQTGEIPAETTLQNLYGYMDQALSRMLFDITRLVGELEQAKARFDAREQEFLGTIRDKDQEIARLRSEKDAIDQAKSELERSKNDEIATLEDQKREAEESLEQAQGEAKDAIAALNNQILALEQDVQKAKRREEIHTAPGPDGQVLAVTEDQGIAILNRGKTHHLMPGTTFDVYTLGKGARKIRKGAVVVLDVEANQARARVIELVSDLNPMVEGDYIESPSYNPEETLHFFLLGRMQKFGRSDAAMRLKQLGVAVDDEVGITTDYLVLGAPQSEDDNLHETDAYKRAQELGVQVITEEKLSEFLNY